MRWRWVLVFLLVAMPAWAQFVDPPVLENCNRTETPLSNGAQWTEDVLNGDASQMTANGTVCVRSATAGNGSVWWNVQTYGPDTRIMATVPDATGSLGNIINLYVRLTSPGVAASTDGYECRFRPQDDDILLRRVDNSVGTTISPGCTGITALADGVQIGCEMIGTALKAYTKTGAGAWTEACAATDATYIAAGNIGILANAAGMTLDDLGWETVVTTIIPKQRAVVSGKGW